MKLPDANVWFAVSVRGHTGHAGAMAWMEQQTGSDTIRFCRPTQQALVRLLTMNGVMGGYSLPPASNAEAWKAYETFLGDDRIAFAPEPAGIEETWKTFASRNTPSPKLWMDAYLAAFAVRAGFQLVTADKAFTQFDGLDLCLLEA
ncbi:TA system VapC family ribonuclease toxin [Haloferula sp. A504]|uniref:TA system VapC family ribonuclease toxin n=1 Tax=Haloferula sp. A504 TaxID=3373601 RepID=UPI0031C3A6C6|nr:PIN domain-containing protein [Verrucomicrobiaceae bacterium E54]